MPIYYVKGETYDIPDDKVKAFEARYPESAVEYENGSDRYRIPIHRREGFLKRFPDARIASLHPEIDKVREPEWKRRMASKNPQILYDVTQEQVVQEKQQEPEYVEGIGAGFKQGWEGVKEGAKFFAGETANLFTGSGLDDKKALATLERLQEEGRTDVLNAGSMEVMDNSTLQDISLIRGAIEEAGGDMDRAKRILSERANELSWGDKQMESAREGMSKMKPTKGFGAWVGNLIPQMLPGAAAIALSFITKNPKYAKIIGGVNLGGMSASTAGQSMMEARDAGATNGETWAVGIVDGVIEAATEKIPYDNYTKRLFNGVKRKVGGEMADVVNNVSSPGRAELEQLLTKANKKLGGKLFSGKNVKEYLASVAAEGASEFTAEALQTITPMIYEEPENYPVLTDILSSGWEGAKAGLFMGSVLGGASKIAEHRQQRARRKDQGYVDVAQVHMGKNDEVVEIVGFDDKTGDYQVLHDGKVRSVKRDDVVESHRFTFDEFDNAELDMEAGESYDNGYSLKTQQEMTDAKNMYEYQRARLAEQLGVEPDVLDDEIGDPINFIKEQRMLDADDSILQSVLDYANAKSTVDGMQQRVNDDIESRVAMSNEQIDQRTHRNDGMVHPATMQLNDRAVHIIDGNIVMTDDGTMVDSRRSDATIIIRDAATGKVEFAAPEAILNVQEPIYAAEEKIAAEEQIRQQFMQEYENKASGRITVWNDGDAYTLADENGQSMDIKLVANEQGVVDNGDGTVNATADGKKVVAVPKERIQQVVDEANMARVAGYAATNEAKEVEDKVATPSYDYDYRVSLQADGKNVSGRIAEITADGDIILDELSSPINGKQSPKLTKAELDGMVVSVQDADGNSVWKREESVLKNTENVPENAENVQNSPISVSKSEDNADLMPLTKDGEPDFYASSPQRSHKFIYEESGLDRNEANEFVQLQLDQANKALEKVKSSSQPKMGTSIMKYKQAKEQHQKLVDEAQNTVNYWKAVRAKQAEISKAEREEMAQKDAVLHAEAVEQANAEREAKKIAEAERAAVGNENPMPAITEKWAKANKVDGIQDEIVLPNGERIKGHYVLHESGASSASHQATNGFQKTDGFPMDEDGNTVNDRDYEGDKEAQDVTRGIASKYDQRALQTPVVVSQDGVVLSGNGRTMAGELAALDGTDSAYNEYLKQYSSKFGFSPEQVSQMQHPRVAFVPDQRMPYTAETFAKFNQQDMKAQNKTEQAVKLGKTVSDEVLAGILRTMNTYDTLGDFYNDASVSSQIVNMLVRDNVVPQAQVAEMYDGNKLSVVGREMLENILIGKSFEGTPDIVRMLTSIPSMRQSVLFALSEISNNLMLGSDYTLKSEIAEAINLCYEARNKGGVQFGDDVITSYARQLNLFADSLQTVADYNNATIMMLANAINDKRISQLKKVLASYNGMAMDSATGQLDLFTGELKERNSIINDVLNLLNNGTEQQINAAGQAAAEKRKDSAAAVSENGASSQSDANEQVVEAENIEGEEEEVLSERVSIIEGEESELEVPGGTEYHQSISISSKDGKSSYIVDKVDSPDTKGEYTGSSYQYDGKSFGGVKEVVDYIDNQPAKKESVVEEPSVQTKIEAAEAETNTDPTEAQKKAGNYKMGHVQIGNFDISIENPAGSERKGVDANGNPWSTKMANTYGYMRGTEGVDGDHIDVFLANDMDAWNGRKVFVVDQYNEDGTFDEHKVMLGFNEQEDAEAAYFANYEKDWGKKHKTVVTPVNLEDFEKWIDSSHRKRKAFAEYKNVKVIRTVPRMDGYTIESRKDTRDNSNLFAVKFDERVSRDEFKGQKEIAKKFSGYWSNFGKKGFLFKSEESAHDFAETVMGRTVEEVEGEAPISIASITKKNDPNAAEYNGETYYIGDQVILNGLRGRVVTINRWKCPVIQTEHATIALRYNGTDDLIHYVESEEETPNNKTNSVSKPEDPYHTDEERAHYEELKKRMRAKLNQLNSGIDPELLEIGVEMAFFHFKGGMRHFADFCKTMIEDCGDKIRPHLKMLYNAAAGTEDFIERGWDEEMDDRKTVRDFDVYNFDKSTVDVIETAQHVVEEAESMQQGEQIVEQIKNERNEEKRSERKQEEADTAALASEAETVASEAEATAGSAALAATESGPIEEHFGFKIGDAVFYTPFGKKTAQKATIYDFEKFDGRPVLDTGLAPVLYEVVEWSQVAPIESKESKIMDTAPLEEAVKKVDEHLEKVNKQLALLGYYEAATVEKDYNESYGYMRNAEKKAVKDVKLLFDKLVKDLGLEDIVASKKSASKGKKGSNRFVYSNIAPIGGDVCMNIPLKDGAELNAYFHLDVIDGDNLQLSGVMYRIEQGGNSRSNNFINSDATYDEMLRAFRYVSKKWLPLEDFVSMAGRIAVQETDSKKETKNKKGKVTQQTVIGDLFGNLNTNDESKNNEEVQLQPGSSAAKREGGHQPRQNEPVGESKQHEAERADGRGMGGRDSSHSVSDEKRSGSLSGVHKSEQSVESKPKNVHNNVAERGHDYAPKGERARVEANIKAIETMNRLLEDGKPATREDMELLRRFSGWGGLGGAFKERIGDRWSAENPINKKLREIMTPEQYEWASGSASASQYFTPAFTIDAMWDIVRAMGFKGGNVLEGSAGIGNILGLMPQDLSAKSNIMAVEKDDAVGQMLSLLYPDAKVEVKGFEEAKIENGSVDLAITNVPFVTGLKVFDTSGDNDLSRKFRDIHNFCIAKNIRKLREGGIGIFISSSGTMDRSPKLMNWIANEGKSDVVGAFRLHSNTFGGTNATSDIIVVRKRVNGRKSTNAIDVSKSGVLRVVPYTPSDARSNAKPKDMALDMNQYFIDHPENMGGEMAFAFEKGETYQETSRRLYPSTDIDQEQRLSSWAKTFMSMDWETSAKQINNQEDTSIVYEDLGEGVKEGTMLLDKNGELCLAQRGKAVPIGVNKNKVKGKTKAECFNDYKSIKDALAKVLDYQTNHGDDKGLAPLLKELNRVYDNFVKTYGHINKNRSIPFLRKDIDFPSIAALENVTEKGRKDGKKEISYSKTDVFKHRVIEKESAPKPQSVKDGIIASIYLHGRVDVPYISEQLGLEQEKVRKDIIESGLGFENPTTMDIEVSYEYLSGNVREKLNQAREANTDGRYDVNIKALEAVVPMNIPAHLIQFSLGSSWVTPKLYTDYIQERTDLDVSLTNAGGTWVMKKPYSVNNEKNKALGVHSEICNKIVYGHELIEAALQNRTISVTKVIKHYNGETETIVDKDATMACANKIDEIRQDFRDWARQKMQSDTELSQEIERVYNEQFNNFVPKEIHDEFIPEHFGGAASIVNGNRFSLRKHQAKAAIRATTQPLMLAHEVGTGKTFTLITTAMEMRRLGTARKPMIVVQNATVGQFVGSAKSLYPNARILTLEDADRTAEGRKNFYAKIRYNDWDMIVVPQSVFERIPDSPEREARFIQDKIEEKMRVVEQLRDASDERDPIVRRAEKELENLKDELNNVRLKLSSPKASVEKDSKDKKREAKAKQNAAVKAQEMLDRETDDTMNFDDMGIDALLIDEAHEYKHLGFETAMQRGVKGVDPSYSKKSQGVYLKTQAVLENNNGRNVVFATGTPISNTAAEIWTFMRYLMPADVMKSYDIFYFDDFVRNFGQIEQIPEFGASGKYKEVNRFNGYTNLPELERIWLGVADTVLTKQAGGVSDKIPSMEGDKAQDVYLPQTKALRSVMKYVKKQLEAFEQMSGKEKKEHTHIPLVMYGIAKAAAVDARLVLNDAADETNSKTNETVRQTLKSLEDSKEYNGTVAIFADNYQNKQSGFNLYEDVRDKLIDKGVPADQIVIMRSGMSIKKKLEIFDKVNRGEVRVIMGSTFTLGTGVNIQERLHTLIHVDAPVRPMDYTQRNGRILRQGNLHKEWGIPVRVLRFGVEDSLDVTAYQRLKTKGAIADSIMNGKQLIADSMNNRVLEEEQDVFGDITAQLSGSEYALLKNQIEKQVKKLESRRSQWEQDQMYIHNQKPRLKGMMISAQERKSNAESFLKKVEGIDDVVIHVGKLQFKNIDAMADYIKDYNSKQREVQEKIRSGRDDKASSKLTVTIGGFAFDIDSETTKDIKYTASGMVTSTSTKMRYTCKELGLIDVPVDGQKLKNAINDILDDVLSGNDFREIIETSSAAIQRYEEGIKQLEAREGKPFEDAEALEQAKAKLEEYDELMKKELEEKEAKYAEIDSEVEVATEVVAVEEEAEEEEEGDEDTLYREVTDDSELAWLENQPTVKAYRAMQVIDGRLYSPMASGKKKNLGAGYGLNKWDVATEMAFNVTDEMLAEVEKLNNSNEKGYVNVIPGVLRFEKASKTGKASLKYHLVTDETDVWAAYNPYNHNSDSMLNDQFKAAYRRGNIVVVEAEVPVGDLESGYRAPYSKDAVGKTEWKSGDVAAQFPDEMKRTVYLSRYTKPVRILSNTEVAKWISERLKKAEQITGEPITLYEASFHPEVKRLLEDDGFTFVPVEQPKGKVSKVLEGHPDYMSDDKIEAINEVLSSQDSWLQRGGDGSFSDEELSYENDPIAKWLGESKRSKNQQQEYAQRMRERMVKRVNELAVQLNLDNVEIITETSTLKGKKARAKGWFSPKTGKIVVVVPNHKSIADVEQTVLHEAVAHYGLRKLFGDHFDDFLSNVYENASEEVRRKISELASKHGWDFGKATEEYLASLAENTNFENAIHEGWFSKIKTFFMRMLAKAGVKLGVELGDNELRYILWRSYENLAEPGRYRDVIEQAADITMQYELGVGNYANSSSGQQHVAEDLLLREKQSLSDVIDDFTSKYNSVPVEIIHNDISVDELMEMFNVDESEAREMQEEIRGGHAAGGYSSSFKKIIIFADTITGEYEATLFHENIHAALERIYKWDDRKIADNFYRATTGKFERAKKALSELYYPDEVAEEFFVFKLSYAMESGDFSDIDSYLPESDIETLNNILKGIGYDKRREEGRRLRIRGRGRERVHGVGAETDEGESLRLRQNEDVSYEKADESDVFFRDGDGGGIGEPDSGGEVDAARSAAELYEKGVANTLWNRFKEGWHDYLRSLNKLQEAIEKATGQKIEDFENVYQHALHKSSVDNAEWRDMMKKYVKPLNDVLHEITHGLKATFRGGKITLEVIETYLNCKHGLERNDKFAMRDAEELVKKRIEKADKELKEELLDAEKLRDRDLRKLADKRMKGLLDEVSYEQAVKAAKEEYDKDVKKAQDARDKKVSKIEKKLNEYYHENRERDYSGLTEIFDPAVNGVRNGLTVEELEQLASEYVKDFEAVVGAHLVGKLWDKVREMNRFSLRKSYETGLISRDSYKRTLDMFEYYVPLRGFDGEKAADVYDYVTEGTTSINDVLKHAGGRTSRAANLVATMMNMGNSAITSGNRNALKQRLLNLANNYDTDGLLTVSNQWYERVGEDEWKPADEPMFKNDMSAEEMRQAVEDFKEMMKEREVRGEVMRMKKGLHLNVRIDSKRKEYEHGVRVKRNGTEYVVWVNGNPKAAQAINGLLNPEIKHGFVLDNLRRLGRFVSKNVTAFSPKFIIRNLKRDVMSANVVGFAKYGAAYTARFNKYVSNNLSLVGVKNARAGKFSGIFDLYWRYEHGKLDMNVQRDRWFKEFIENGGETGYSQVWSIEDYQHELKKQLKKHRADSQVMQLMASMGAGVEFLNRGIENVCRFAAYCASRESGMNVLDSVRDAKEASVNFNKKGSGALGNAGAKALFMFLNPGIQGLAQQIILTKKYPKRMLPVLAGEIALGAIAVSLAQWVGDDDEDEDDYFNLNPYVRRNNFILRVGNHEYLRWDLPPDLRPWYGLGEIGASALAGKLKYENVPLALLTNFSQLLPLDPVNDKALVNDDENMMKGVFKNILRGTGAGSLADAYLFDEDFLGRQITRATEWNKLDPEWKRAGRNTSGLMIALSKKTNEKTGGDDATPGWLNFNPSKLEHALKGTLGGWIDFPVSFWKGCEAFFSDDLDEKLDTRNYPIIGDTYIRTDNSWIQHTQTRTAYQWYKHEHDVFDYKLKTYDHEAYEGGVLEYAEKVADMYKSPAYDRYKLVDGYMNEVDDLYRSLKLTSDKNVQQDILNTIDKVKKEMVDRLEMMEKDGE